MTSFFSEGLSREVAMAEVRRRLDRELKIALSSMTVVELRDRMRDEAVASYLHGAPEDKDSGRVFGAILERVAQNSRAMGKTMSLASPALIAAASSMSSLGRIAADYAAAAEKDVKRRHLETSPMTPGDDRTAAMGYFADLMTGKTIAAYGGLESDDWMTEVDLKAIEAQRKWNDSEHWRVKSLNAVLLGSPRAKELFAMRGRAGVKFRPMPWASRLRASVGNCESSNIEALTQTIIEVGMVEDHWTDDRYRSATKMTSNWSEQNHTDFLSFMGLTEDVYAGDAIGVAVSLDDGIDLDEVVDELVPDNSVAGTW